MGRIVSWLDRTTYPGIANNWDDAMLRRWVLAALNPNAHVLDLGAGAGIVAEMNFRGLAARVCGVDPDPRVLQNRRLDEGKIGYGEAIPYGDGLFDLVLADNVLEHLENPTAVLREVSRVLKPGGLFIAKTPNVRHYVPLIARMTPLWFHKLFNRLRKRNTEDTFPTLYQANCRRDVATVAAAAGLSLDRIDFCEGRPEYLRFSVLTYLVGIAYERIVNAVSWLERFRVVMLVQLRKPVESRGA
jgi:SAM-dependent methyltransferase